MLDKQLLESVEQGLLKEKQRLEQELLGLADKDEESKEYTTRYVDYGDSEEDNAEEYRQHEVNLSISKNLETALADVVLALEKISAGTYGVCENCKKEINPERLKAYPAAKICMDCGK